MWVGKLIKQIQDSRDRSPRRDRQDQRDRSPRRYREDYRDGREGRGGQRGGNGARYGDNQALHSKSDRNYENSIFVGNLPFDCDWAQLKDHFQGVGNVIRADIVTQNGRPRGMGTVEFSSKSEVDRAISQYDHTPFLDREIFVRQDNPPPSSNGRRDRFSERSYGRERGYGRDYGRDYGRSYGDRGGYGSYDRSYGGSRQERGGYGGGRGGYSDRYPPRRDERPLPKGYEVFVANLPFSVNWQALKDLFRECGNITHADVRLDNYGRSRGFGIVSFENKEDVETAIEKYHGYELEGRVLDVHEGKNNAALDSSQSLSNNRPASQTNSQLTEGVEGNGDKNDTIYVENLPFATSNQDLLDLFDTVAQVEAAEIKFDASGRPSGSAVVKFDSDQYAEAAIEKLNGYTYGGRELNITFARLP